MLPRIITKIVGWAVALFYDVERTGPELTSGPVLVAANHPNALVDPLVIFHTAGRPTRPLAKAPLFEQLLVGTVLKGLGGLPVYRKQDDPALMHLNDRTFDAAIEALQKGGAVQIYPEGQSHSEPSLTPLRTGASRIALQAEERSGWTLGLHVQPVGLTYKRKTFFRGRAIAAFGTPIPVGPLKAAYEADERVAVRQLTDSIRDGLEALTLNYRTERDRELVDVAERLWARQRGLAKPRERGRMADRLPRLQGFANTLRWLEDEDPERVERLRHSVSRYLRLLTLFGAREGDVPRRYKTGAVLRYSARQLSMLLLVLPAALVGMVVWSAPFLFTRYAARSFRPLHDQVATYKLSVGFVSFCTWWAATTIAVGWWRGWQVAVAVFILMPVVGIAAVAWKDRQAVVTEDVLVFLRARRRSESRDRLAEQRARLVEEFDAIADLRRTMTAD